MTTDINSMLNGLLADYMVYYQKLRNYHWNVKGKEFFKLHEEFEKAYLEAAEFADDIAERVLARDGSPYSTMAQFIEHSSINEDSDPPEYEDMVRNIISDIESLDTRSIDIIQAAEDQRDRTTANLLDDMLDIQEERKWMLRTFLAD